MVDSRIGNGKYLWKLPEYGVWNAMLSRCYNPNTWNYERYGGRGITVCDEWFKFEGFYKDMGNKPFKGAEIDRIDNSKGYSKDNCCWVTRQHNTRNRRTACFIDGIHFPEIRDICREIGINEETIHSRFRRGFTLDECLDLPIKGLEQIWPIFKQRVLSLKTQGKQ